VDKRLYLRVGDRVFHAAYEWWGEGRVVQVMSSIVPGGTCLVRILFEDGQQRTFGNDLDSESCCYYFGIRRMWTPSLETIGEPVRRRRRTTRRLLNRLS
jgi:hypothetical protein